jgi:hypothetical protein
MPEFLQVIESIRSEEASIGRLFGGEGRGIRSQPRGVEYQHRLAEAATFIAEIFEGRRPAHQLREAMTTSDFPYLFGDIIDRQLLANYQEAPATYRNYCRVAEVNDFRTVKRFALNGSEAVLDAVPQQTEYPASSLSDAYYSYAVTKYGRTVPFSWEAIVNDDLGALRDIPQRLGRAARRTEEKLATQLFVDTAGPHATLYSVAHKNIVNVTNAGSAFTAINPPLSIAALQQAMVVLANEVDSDGEPIVIDAVELVVPPALEVTAQNILNATQLWVTGAGGTTTQMMTTVNWMAHKVHLSVNAYIPLVASSSNGSTSWFLFASPGSTRPALEIGFLRGHASPELFMRDSDQVRVGGGASDPLNGDFETDSIVYKVRHVLGGTRMEYRATVASNGSGA